MISLILLPLFCMQYFLRCQHRLDSMRVLGVMIPGKQEACEVIKEALFDCQRIILRGDASDEVKSNYARAIIHEVPSKQSLPPLEFIFTNQSKYWSIVKLLDVCVREGVPKYQSYQNRFRIFNSQLQPEALPVVGVLMLHYIPLVLCQVINTGYIVPSLKSANLERFILPAILFTVMIGLLILKTRIVALRSMRIKRPKTFESPSDNPDE